MSRSRIKRKQAKCLDASGVQAIADMQRYIDNLENYLWRMCMLINGRDTAESIILFTEEGSATGYATKAIHDFIEKNKRLLEELEEIESLLTQSDDVDDIVYSYHQIEGKIKEHVEKKGEGR